MVKYPLKKEKGITDEMIACIKTEGAGESTGRLIGTSIGAQAAPAVSQIPIVGWLATGWVCNVWWKQRSRSRRRNSKIL